MSSQIPLLIALVACGPEVSEPGTTPAPTTATTTTTSTTTATAAPDEPLVRELLDGTADLDEVLHAVAWSDGWPVHTEADSWIFVARDEGASLALQGDLNGWVPQPMTAGAGFWWIEVAVPDPAGSGYKFDTGGALQADPWARSYTWDAYGELSFVRPPDDRPRLDRWPDLEAVGLAPRDLRVWVPQGAGPWPVLYMHDGQNLFDPGAIWGGWRLQDSLAAELPMVVVGIDNTADRFEEYTHVPDDIGSGPLGGQSAAYGQLIGEHIRPHVEAVYGSTGHDGLLGSSLGGLVSLAIAHDQPGDWDFVGSMSGTLGWGKLGMDNPVMDQVWSDVAPGGALVFLDSGGVPSACVDLDGDGYSEDDPGSFDNYCATLDFAWARVDSGWTWDVDLVHWHEYGATHDELAWSARVWRPLALFADAR